MRSSTISSDGVIFRVLPVVFLFFFLSSVSLDQSEEQQDSFLKELPKRCLFLPYEDPYRRCVGLSS